MATPTVVFGQGGLARLLVAEGGVTDAGQPITTRLVTARVAPGGAAGEAGFYAVYLVLSSTFAGTLAVTPIVDGVRYEAETQRLVIPAQAQRVTRRYELGLSQGLTHDGAEVARFALRGIWFQLEIALESVTTDGALVLHGVELECEVLGESQRVEAR